MSIITELSPTINGTGIPSETGSILESDFSGAFSEVHIADTVFAYRKDVTGSSFSFNNISTPAGDDTTSDFLPFGTDTQMTAGDKFYIACDHPKKELFFKIDTPAVWTGTMAIKYSTDGLTANATLQAVVDNTNGFRASAGIYGITFTVPTDIKAFSPVPGDVPSKEWFVFEPTITAVTTAPILSRAWIHHTEHLSINMSTNINQDIVSQGSGHPPTFFPTIDSSMYYAFGNPAYGMERDIFRRADNVRTRVAEYYANDNTWKTLQGWTDPSNDFKNGSATQATTATRYSVRWTIPSDWSAKSLTFTTSTGAITHSGYWIREKTTAVSAYGPAQTTLSNVSARQFGSANTTSIKSLVATTIRGVRILSATIPNTTAMEMECANADTGKSSAFTIPINPSFPQNYDFTDIAIAANEGYFLICKSGGTMRNCQIEFIE